MKIRNIIYTALIFIVLMSSTNTENKKMAPQMETEINTWFNKGEWREGLAVEPDESTNKEVFYNEFNKNRNLWEKAFEHFKTVDLNALEIGRYELVKDSLYVNIDEYSTKNEEDTKYEAHRKFADIQYLISGTEKIGVNPLDTSTVVNPYNDEKDIAFYAMSNNNYRHADQDVFFVFFPHDAHRPCVKVLENGKVKKVVYKVRLAQ